MDNRPKSFAEITPEMVTAWKDRYRKKGKDRVKLIAVEDELVSTGKFDDKGKEIFEMTYKQGYVRFPDRNDIKVGLTKGKDATELDMVEAILEEVWLGGDIDILEDDDFFMGAVSQMKELINFKDAQIKNA